MNKIRIMCDVITCCPDKVHCQAINMDSKESEELLCFGSIHNYGTQMNIIQQYAAIEMVHLICKDDNNIC